MRQVSKEFYELSNMRSVWNDLLYRHVIRQNIPIPGLGGKSIESLTTKQLEKSLSRALRLRQNWTAELPLVKRRLNLDAIPGHRIVSIHLLPGSVPQKIISLSMSYGQRRFFVLECWELHHTNPIRLARRELHRFSGLALNKTVSDGGFIAILNPHVEILSLDLQAIDAAHGFRTLATIQEEQSGISLFSGSSILTRDNNSRLYLWDINRPQSKIELRNPSLDQPFSLLEAVVTQDFIVALKVTTLELYALPSLATASVHNAVLHPVFTFQWPWRIDHGVMTLRHRPAKNPETTSNGIYIVMRFSSYFPWAINLLHHYEVRPNPFFLKNSPVSVANLPYEFPPVLRETIGSPVRLHATSDLAIGPYGTAIWTDSHTEDYFNHADRGQRLAGRFSPYISGEEDEGVELSDQVATALATSVYAYQEEDSWVRVAFDETEGRIVVGRDDGNISVLEFI
ncbi:hypothetical protein GALMADRAFT_241233 [Galerina marginata CBS 339.88]|uniref:F-box domain-containing protein n=1 Tax=Galerina marginata (strain CBS 339.88) TaxID=685588 RepID=A0A067TEL2_GALM3|nr:hypothetical protein GALMADRAFT_241233 [Galerina marginata CBS 339.88]